ncbi:MAG TPA: hypothetical protein VK797_30060, partial [Tepidisphaeraceae bacterium]|nr:hypothetical protein [Tepidisphaeraceae bacterium]
SCSGRSYRTFGVTRLAADATTDHFAAPVPRRNADARRRRNAVLTTGCYAIQIARDWNTKDAASRFVGYVTRFQVRAAFLSPYPVRKVGGRDALEYWIPAEDLDAFNRNIVGAIEIVHTFGP